MIICQSQHEVGEVIQNESSWKTLLYHSEMKRVKETLLREQLLTPPNQHTHHFQPHYFQLF